MTKNTKLIYAVAVLSLCFVQIALADSKDDYDPSNGIGKHFKQSETWLEMETDFRLRVVYDEAGKLDKEANGHDRLNTRYRSRIRAKIKQSENLDFNIRLMTEPRYYHRPSSMDKQFTYHEAIFDQLNFAWRNAFDLPVTTTIGRQEVNLGSGWLLRDGTPLDGGRTNFFDAFRFTYDLEEYNTTADLIWIEDYGDSSKLIEPFNSRDIDLAEQDEHGAILYLAKKEEQDSGIDGYFIYKHDSDRNRTRGSEGEIYTLGIMKYGKFSENWRYCFELAPQFGHKNGKELNAFATNNLLAYHFNDTKKNSLHIGYEYLSGDNDPDRNFDKVWGRIDTWSVLYQGIIDSIDGRESDASNLHRLNFGWITEPRDKIEVTTGYHLLFADDNTSSGGTNGMSKSGNFRGQLLRAQIKYKISEHVYHRLEGELFFPGDFYNDDRNDVGVFVRYEIMFTW
jgi:hypothetical protein